MTHAFLNNVKNALESHQNPSFRVLLCIYIRVLKNDFMPLWRIYRAVEGDICVINGQKMPQIFMLAGAKAKGFYTHARQTHYFNSTKRYHFAFVDRYDVYSSTQIPIVGASAHLIALPAPQFSSTRKTILIASQPVAQEREKLFSLARHYPLAEEEKLLIRFHPRETAQDKALWRQTMAQRPCAFMESTEPLNFSHYQLCISLNSALTITMKKAAIPTICLDKCC